MPDLFSALDLGLEMSRFLQSAEGNVTKVILQPTQRDAEIVLELSQQVLAEHASRAFVVMVQSEGGSMRALVKPAIGAGYHKFVDPGGPIVLLVRQETIPHLRCDDALWRRLHPEAAMPEPARTSPAAKEPDSPLKVLGHILGVIAFFAVLLGSTYLSSKSRRERAAQPAATPTNVVMQDFAEHPRDEYRPHELCRHTSYGRLCYAIVPGVTPQFSKALTQRRIDLPSYIRTADGSVRFSVGADGVPRQPEFRDGLGHMISPALELAEQSRFSPRPAGSPAVEMTMYVYVEKPTAIPADAPRTPH